MSVVGVVYFNLSSYIKNKNTINQESIFLGETQHYFHLDIIPCFWVET